ncbi:cell division protein FtsZ [Candidatus Malacoplasma girerdii]|uniref:Cell division protein FtsZ n=1 Tax=Candidatus Malacoplasma girerdii TaxID=1318617 RepID=A0A097SSZ1_9BACT|nr:cell division protein FtsZ [Candidatus Malacoplasma girerdii]
MSINKILDEIINNEKQNNPTIAISNDYNFVSNFDDLEEEFGQVKIKVIGVGGAGCNVIEDMLNEKQWDKNIEIYAFNTDWGALKRLHNRCNCFLLGRHELKGTGSGGNPLVGKQAAINDLDEIKQILNGTQLLILVAGLGKGTGSGATPEIAKLARSMGILTISIVNLPSIQAEGRKVYANSINNFKQIVANSDSYCSISNDKIIQVSPEEISLFKAFNKANQQVSSLINTITTMINVPTSINIDFADVKTFFTNARVFMPIAFSIDSDQYNFNAIKDSFHQTLKNSYSNVPIKNADSVLVNIKLPIETSLNLVTDIKTIFNQLTSNHEISLVYGIDKNQTDKQITLNALVASSVDEESVLNANNYNDLEIKKVSEVTNGKNDDLVNDWQFTDENNGLNSDDNNTKAEGLKTISFDDTTPNDTEHITTKLDSNKYKEIITKALKKKIKKDFETEINN